MSKLTSIGLLGAAVMSTVLLATSDRADARDRHGNRAGRHEIRQDWTEIRRDRAELARDIREYNRDREALRRAYRRGANPGRLDHLRDEVRQGRQEILQGRRELRNDYTELRRDLDRHGHGGYDNHGRGWWYGDDNWRRGGDHYRYGSWNRDQFERRDRDFWRD